MPFIWFKFTRLKSCQTIKLSILHLKIWIIFANIWIISEKIITIQSITINICLKMDGTATIKEKKKIPSILEINEVRALKNQLKLLLIFLMYIWRPEIWINVSCWHSVSNLFLVLVVYNKTKIPCLLVWEGDPWLCQKTLHIIFALLQKNHIKHGELLQILHK